MSLKYYSTCHTGFVDTVRSLTTPIGQRHLKAEVAHCVAGVLSPLLANIALSVLDEHLHWPEGSMSTEYRRPPPGPTVADVADRPLRPRLCLSCMAPGTGSRRRDRPRAGTDGLAVVGCENPGRRVRLPWFRIQRKRKRGTTKHYVYTCIGQRPIRSLKAKIRALTHRTSQQNLGFVLAKLNQVVHGWLGELLQTCRRQERVQHAGQLHLVANHPHAAGPASLEMERRPPTIHRPNRPVASNRGR
jgi:hypothetical protein